MPSLKEQKNNFKCDYSQLITSAAVIFVVLDPKGKVAELNKFTLDLLGYDKTEIIGKDWFSLCLPEGRQIYKMYKDIIAGKISPISFYKNSIITKNKKEYLVKWTNTYARNSEGRIQYCVSIGYDVTAETAREKEYAANSQLMSAIFHTSPQAILSFDRNLIINQWNEAAEKIFGYARSEVIGKVSPLVPKGALAGIKKMYERIFDHGENFSYEGLRKTKSGTDIIIKAYAGPVKDDEGNIIAAMALIDNITARKEEAKTQAFLKSGIDKSDSAIFLTDKEGKIIFVNPAFENLYGFSQAEVLGKTSRVLNSPSQSNEMYDKRWRDLMSGKNVRNEIINQTKDGREITLLNSTNPVTDASGNIIGFIALQHDITEETNNKKKLEELIELNHQVIDSSPLGTFILNKEGVVEYVNREMLKISGSPLDKLLGYNLLNNENYIKLGLSAKIMDAIHQNAAFETEPMKYRSLFGKKESYRIFSGVPIKSADGKVSKILVSIRDVSELVKHNEELERFNSLMVGRELKMVELKNQVQQLKLQLGIAKEQDALIEKAVKRTEDRQTLDELVDRSERLIGDYGRLFSIELPQSDLGIWEKYQIRHLIRKLINKNIECKKSLLNLTGKNERQ